MKKAEISAEEFDRKFDAGEDISEYIDWSSARRPNREGRDAQRVNVDMPQWMVEALDREAKRLGVPRQAVIKVAIDNHLQSCSRG